MFHAAGLRFLGSGRASISTEIFRWLDVDITLEYIRLRNVTSFYPPQDLGPTPCGRLSPILQWLCKSC